MHADWVLVGGMIPSNGAPALTYFLMPVSDGTVIDTWQVDGMVATGSNDIVIKNMFVPARRILSLNALRMGEAFGPSLYDSWIYRLPMQPMLALTASIAAVAAARSMVEQFAARLIKGDAKLTDKDGPMGR